MQIALLCGKLLNSMLMHRISSVLAILLWCTYAQAQTVPASADASQQELLEYFFLNNEQATEANAQVFLEQLDYLSQNKLNLNTASLTELTSSQLIPPTLAQSLLAYRSSLGALISIHELQAVPGWNLEDIKRILPFVEIGNLDTRSQASLFSLLKSSKKDLLLRYAPRSSSGDLPSSAEGSEHAFAVRFRAQAAGRLRMGILMEKDPGETMFKGSNKQGFDYYGAYLFLKNSPEKRVRLVALGDYQVRLGQGLIVFSGLAFGKSPNTTLVLRGSDAVGPFTSFAEGLAMRGAATTIRCSKQIEATIFGSRIKRDANLSLQADTLLGGIDEVFTALQSSGLHRTPGENADEKAITETAAGF
jgi:DNA uptake protein ComE-like DNA-binding protein